MGHIVYPQPTSPGSVDLSWMVGRSITSVTFDEPVDWTFWFGDKGHISALCPWRILQNGRIVCGLPAPIDPAVSATDLLSSARVVRAWLQESTLDILVEFSGQLFLEIIPMSSSYECWHLTDPFGTEFFAIGGEISILRPDA
jgi:hypothetical protein